MIFIEDVICRVEECWAACSGFVGVGIKYTKEGESSKWLSVVDGEGGVEFYLSDENYIEKRFAPAVDEDETEDICELEEQIHILSYEGIKLDGGYKRIVSRFNDSMNDEAKKLLKYLFIIALCTKDETDKYIQLGMGKNLDDVVLPSISRFVA